MFDSFDDALEHSIRISKDVVVPETQDAKAAILQIGITCFIGRVFCMLATICLDNEHLFESDEVDDPKSDGNLSTEFDISELS